MKQILMENPHPEPLIYMQGVEEPELNTFLQLMYYGAAKFNTSRMDKLAKVTRQFELNGFQIPPMKIIDFQNVKKKEDIHRNNMLTNSRKNRNSKSLAIKLEEEDNLFSCSYCNFQSSRSNNVKRHEEGIHEGIRYDCDQCDYKAKDKSRLNVHQKNVHGGKRQRY